MFFSSLLRPLIFKLDPEQAHLAAIKALEKGLVYTDAQYSAARHIINNKKFNITKAGLNFSNPLGLAAGFDKNAQALCGITKLGFGFVEVGTVTPQPQSGNAKPRLFRLVEAESIINRMGFNNDGATIIYKNLSSYTKKDKNIIGVNIGANKDSQDKISDYIKNIEKFYDIADYLTLNISSPNTTGLRKLQDKENLGNLLRIVEDASAKQKIKGQKYVPIFLKIAPDLEDAQLEDIADIFAKSSLDGLIVSNTTITREGVNNNIISYEAGGLSGKALFNLSNKVLAKMRKLLGKDKVIIGVGGVDDSASFIEKIKAGADLVQLYTGLVFKGPNLPYNILAQALKQMNAENISHISEYRDLHIDKWIES